MNIFEDWEKHWNQDRGSIVARYYVASHLQAKGWNEGYREAFPRCVFMLRFIISVFLWLSQSPPPSTAGACGRLTSLRRASVWPSGPRAAAGEPLEMVCSQMQKGDFMWDWNTFPIPRRPICKLCCLLPPYWNSHNWVAMFFFWFVCFFRPVIELPSQRVLCSGFRK